MSETPPVDANDKHLKALSHAPRIESDSEAQIERFARIVLSDSHATQYDAEVFKVVGETTQQEQEHRLAQVMRELDVEDAENERRHLRVVQQNRAMFRIYWGVMVAVISVIGAAVYLVLAGRESVGLTILSHALTLLCGYSIREGVVHWRGR